MRIDRYFEGELDQPDTYLQPVMCQHCEQAPCEVVCPVAATVHTDEGLNTMAYNRCVGTRYCGNNCPYKVRRFNFFHYSDEETASLKLQRNPDVTIRHRGVMEKCSYCIQRINQAKIEASVKDLPLSQVGLVSACQQACPTGAIEFGDLNDPDTRVAAWQSSDLAYGILTELGTRPRTMYLKRVSNPNPELARS
jgi:molybdopterin-containing oxidoreductase family iron-sulfur binding subunit